MTGSNLSSFAVTAVNGSYSIPQAPSAVTLTCPASVSYNGTAQTPCTANVTGVGGLNQSVSVTYSANTNAGVATASATFAGDSNHVGSTNSTNFTIAPATLTVTAGSYSGAYDNAAHAPSACTSNYTGVTCAANSASVGPGISSGVVGPVATFSSGIAAD